ncbi:CsgE family curli-type amyloid fiber assembly protein [Solirubrum puertoriconensis]|uniref:Curli production assembly/transport component CsgE n=1 Tax=Solirubrum puertoriconensis TaxID=1751427 RepID=A0A9X0HM02_SOLP1|nr:CsgE family curli-type amyloid fiber assembly protein [Solirubrum puertoriconensis]KUG08436.1 hypothetical protein ASU33_09730 [Solirubrum puertoriconensis]
MKAPAAWPIPPVPTVCWWRPWLLAVASVALFWSAALPAHAQAEKKVPTRTDAPSQRAAVPARENKSAPLPPKKLEEALQLLLSADSVRKSAPRALGPESAGLVIDQTITKIGHDFYDAFYAVFEPPPGVSEYSVVIAERPARMGNSALVVVSVDNTELLEMPMQARYDVIEASAADAAASVYGYLESVRNLSQQLEQGELRGTAQY